jgi:Meiotically up-regulated gene 113
MSRITKEEIIQEIQQTAKNNGNIALGKGRFLQMTGIKESDWQGRYWARWSDAVREAGFEPNAMQVPLDETILFEKYIALTREKNRFPVNAEIQLQTRIDPTFPASSTFSNRFGTKESLVARLAKYCEGRDGYEDILRLCAVVPIPTQTELDATPQEKVGYVYLIQHGSRREYKIGKTFNPVRREGEITLQLPEKVQPIHYIKTDDPSGVEKYWHNRFADKRKEGEWFALTSGDVLAFKKWQRIY